MREKNLSVGQLLLLYLGMTALLTVLAHWFR